MEMRTIRELLYDIDNSVLVLPKFQRPYVWNRSDVRELMDDLTLAIVRDMHGKRLRFQE